MAVPESKRKANAKWDKENMTVLGCKLRKEQAVAFKAYCTGKGKTPNAVLKDFVLDCIRSHEEARESSGQEES